MNEAVTNLYINDWWSETEVLDDLFYNSTQCRVIKEMIDSESMMKLFAAVKQKWFSIESQFRLNIESQFRLNIESQFRLNHEYIYYICLRKSNSLTISRVKFCSESRSEMSSTFSKRLSLWSEWVRQKRVSARNSRNEE